MQFITTGNRIMVENFNIGDIYTITFTNGNYKSLACIGKGTDFVMFQDTLPDLLFCLTMGTSEDVDTIDEGGGGSGTMNYNELNNKPSINGVVLIGNKTASDLSLASTDDLSGKQDTLTETQLTAVNSGITSGLVTQIGTNTTAIAGKQDALSSSQLTAVNSGITSGLVTQIGTNTTAIAGKQDALSSSQLTAVNSGITSALVGQISTNENNISKIHNPANVYFSETAPTGTIPMQSYWISSTGVHVYGDDVYGATLEQGSFETFSGAEITANNRVRTTFDNQAPTGTYTVSAEGADDVVIYAYTSNSTSSWSSADSITAWQPLPFTFTTAQNLYLRFAFRRNDNTAIAPSDVSNIEILAHKWTT